eukprot:2021711-Lingulodinium_polyedra.AAC.1
MARQVHPRARLVGGLRVPDGLRRRQAHGGGLQPEVDPRHRDGGEVRRGGHPQVVRLERP